MIQIDMPMPTNCIDCPACNEYLMCAIPANGRGWGENDVHEFDQGRPEWCPLKEQEAVEPIKPLDKDDDYTFMCSKCKGELFCGDVLRDHFCPSCGGRIEWKDGEAD